MTYDLTKFDLGDIQAFARAAMGEERPRSSMKCLTLMATVGETAVWNSRFLSRGHRAIPLQVPRSSKKHR
jgi:hypothetical protein